MAKLHSCKKSALSAVAVTLFIGSGALLAAEAVLEQRMEEFPPINPSSPYSLWLHAGNAWVGEDPVVGGEPREITLYVARTAMTGNPWSSYTVANYPGPSGTGQANLVRLEIDGVIDTSWDAGSPSPLGVGRTFEGGNNIWYPLYTWTTTLDFQDVHLQAAELSSTDDTGIGRWAFSWEDEALAAEVYMVAQPAMVGVEEDLELGNPEGFTSHDLEVEWTDIDKPDIADWDDQIADHRDDLINENDLPSIANANISFVIPMPNGGATAIAFNGATLGNVASSAASSGGIFTSSWNVIKDQMNLMPGICRIIILLVMYWKGIWIIFHDLLRA